MSGPRFSVIVPTHDRPAFLSEAVESILAQTITDFEVIVVDDESMPAVCPPADSRVRVLRVERNLGPAGARNAGLDEARGEYVTFLDDDDLYLPNRLVLAAEGLARAPVTICWGRFAGRPAGDNVSLEGSVGARIFEHPIPHLGCTAVRREALMRFDERWAAIEDVAWWFEIARRHPLITIPRIGFLYRRHDGQRNRNDVTTRLRENVEFLDEHGAYFRTNPRAASYRWKRIGLMALSVGRSRIARQAFRRSLRLHPQPSTAWHLLRSMPAREPVP